MCKEKLIKTLVNKLWDNSTFQQAIVDKIGDNFIKWMYDHYKKYVSIINGYIIAHDVDQMVPYVYVSEEEVRNQVKIWDERAKVENEVKPAQKSETKPKRKYNRRKKEAVKED